MALRGRANFHSEKESCHDLRYEGEPSPGAEGMEGVQRPKREMTEGKPG